MGVKCSERFHKGKVANHNSKDSEAQLGGVFITGQVESPPESTYQTSLSCPLRAGTRQDVFSLSCFPLFSMTCCLLGATVSFVLEMWPL